MKEQLYSFIIFRAETILLIIVLLIIGTGIFYNDFFPSIYKLPLTWYSYYPSDDFNTSIYLRTSQMLKGEEMRVPGWDSASGQLMPLLFAPFLFFLKLKLESSYFYYLGMTIIIYIAFFLFLNRAISPRLQNINLLFLIGFILSEPGYLGLRQGNIDIVLAPVVGIIIILLIDTVDKRKMSLLGTLSMGIISGAIVNAKIYLLFVPILIASFIQKRIIFTTVSVLTFIILIYLPNLFNSESSLLLFLYKITEWNSIVPLTHSLWANHSAHAIASYFSNCFEFGSCNKDLYNNFIAYTITSATVFLPFLFSKKLITLIQNREVINGIKVFQNKELMLIIIALFVALINVAITIAYDYRLYYSFIFLLIVLKYVINDKQSLVYAYLSVFFLLSGGLWLINFEPDDLKIVDPRIMKIFFLFHFFFLLRSVIVHWENIHNKSLELSSPRK